MTDSNQGKSIGLGIGLFYRSTGNSISELYLLIYFSYFILTLFHLFPNRQVWLFCDFTQTDLTHVPAVRLHAFNKVYAYVLTYLQFYCTKFTKYRDIISSGK